MVEGFPLIQISDGVCHGFLVGKHPEKRYDVGKEHRNSSILDLMHIGVSYQCLQHQLMVLGISLVLLMIVLGFAG